MPPRLPISGAAERVGEMQPDSLRLAHDLLHDVNIMAGTGIVVMVFMLYMFAKKKRKR